MEGTLHKTNGMSVQRRSEHHQQRLAWLMRASEPQSKAQPSYAWIRPRRIA